jgi:hypothetical protein
VHAYPDYRQQPEGQATGFCCPDSSAFLVYIAAGDVHGTLGGLVELGRPQGLGEILEAAAESATWCATDPVCIEYAPGPRGRGSDARRHIVTEPNVRRSVLRLDMLSLSHGVEDWIQVWGQLRQLWNASMAALN